VSATPARGPLVRVAAALALALIAGGALGSDWRSPPRSEGPETLPVRRLDGDPYVAVNDLARVLDATKFWRADLRRLVLRSGSHSFTLTEDNPFVILDDRTVWLPTPVRSLQGEFQVPAAMVDSLPADSLLPRLRYDPRRERVVVLPPSGGVGSPRIIVLSDVTRIVFPADQADEAVVFARARARFRIRFGGFFTGALPDSLPEDGLVRAIRPIPSAGGSAFEMVVAPEASGYRLIQNVALRRVTLELQRAANPELEPFADEGPPGPRPVRVIVIDPGHGGNDLGVIVGDAIEKDLTLQLAKFLKPELEHRLPAHVILTRDGDQSVSGDRRAEIANRSRADLVLSLHLDGFGDPRARGATGYCPPATVGAGTEGEGGRGPLPVVLLPWRDVASGHAVESRALAEAVLSAIELRGQGPTRLRERLSTSLLGVNAPGILLECATLTAPGDRDRVLQEEGLRDLAASIAEGVVAYQRNQ